MKKLEEIILENKKVIIRVDFNVPLNDKQEIVDDSRIKASLKTINYCLKNNAKVILLSHLGKVKTENDKLTKSLKPISKRLSELLNKDVLFLENTRGLLVEESIKKMNNQDIILLENTRFEDLNDKKESQNNQELAKYWASLGDVFINDAFATCHRKHASNVGISTYIKEKCLGFLVLEELEKLKLITNKPKKPFIVILGGAKVNDKINVIKNLILKADYILIGGAMAYTFLKAKNEEIGKSLIDNDSLEFANEMLKSNKIILPIDYITSYDLENDNYFHKTILKKDDMGLDIGPKTIELFKSYLKNSETIFWNGPMGYYENKNYQTGTLEIAKYIATLNNTSIIGGGDTASCIINMGYKDCFTHISTGGGASLDFIAGYELPGVNL